MLRVRNLIVSRHLFKTATPCIIAKIQYALGNRMKMKIKKKFYNCFWRDLTVFKIHTCTLANCRHVCKPRFLETES